MTKTHMHANAVNPIEIFVRNATRGRHPVPLVETGYDVTFDAGFAVIEARRVFRNDEPKSIEAVLTFPMPVAAAVFDLEARIGGRTLRAKAKRRAAARESYEAGIDAGKASMLHEELMPGIHMLSVGQVGPGATIEIVTRFAMVAADVGGKSTLRIPLTVGQVYGCTGLSDLDELTHAPSAAMAALKIFAPGATCALDGRAMPHGEAQVSLARPIDLSFSDWRARDIEAHAADGRRVRLNVTPAPAGRGAIDAAILVDHSTSMAEAAASGPRQPTKHQALVATLNAVADTLGHGDHVDLWQFNTSVTRIGATPRGSRTAPGAIAAEFQVLAARLAPPTSGTEIGGALDAVVAHSEARDVLLITDGKSHAIDVQKHAMSGRRFSVLLVGEDSLDAHVGRLAALTGGELFVASSADLAAALTAAFSALRRPADSAPPAASAEISNRVTRTASGMTIAAAWATSRTAVPPHASVMERAVAAYAAYLLLPSLPEEAAAALAEAEGLVSHLTSLVLVDMAGATQETLPETRKVALPTPATQLMFAASAPCDAVLTDGNDMLIGGSGVDMAHDGGDDLLFTTPAPLRRLRKASVARIARPASHPPADRLLSLARSIEWSKAASLAKIELGTLPPDVVAEIMALARTTEIVALATTLALDPRAVVIALAALSVAKSDRAAARVLRALLGGRPESALVLAAA